MRCLACNVVLNDKEATRKYASSGTFVDLCDRCFNEIEDKFPVIEGKGTNGLAGKETEE
jgi:hypothetical protein